MHQGERIAARARSMVGMRFRPQGRSAGEGLDCVGLVAAALGLSGVKRNYALRGGSLEELAEAFRGAGLREVTEPASGDVLVMRPGAGQLHLAVWTGSGLVHADAGLRRVVERPGEVPWPVVGVWRLDEAVRDGPSTIGCADGPPSPRSAPGRI
jgi:murein DD-endopeptidase / murein LD-carboxypeptidase